MPLPQVGLRRDPGLLINCGSVVLLQDRPSSNLAVTTSTSWTEAGFMASTSTVKMTSTDCYAMLLIGPILNELKTAKATLELLAPQQRNNA